MRYSTRSRMKGAAALAVLVFGLPLITAIPLTASINLLHHQWWSAIPPMQYGAAYWWGVITFAIGVPTWLVVHKMLVWLNNWLD